MHAAFPAHRASQAGNRRRLFGALLLLALTSPAFAEDFPYPPVPTLPPPTPPQHDATTVGPATFTRWSGFYVGGQIGFSNGNADFSGASISQLTYALRETTIENEFGVNNWEVLGAGNSSAATYGGFVGYNSQWQDLILGIEANLNRANFTLHAPNTPAGPLYLGADSLNLTHTVTIDGSGSVQNLDFATLRVRAGYVIGSFMPYAFGGLALGLANVSVSSTALDTQCTSATPPVCTNFVYSGSYLKSNEVLYGFTVGGGFDFALTSNIFLRAEFEWDQFNPPPGILMTVATGRVGAGFKF